MSEQTQSPTETILAGADACSNCRFFFRTQPDNPEGKTLCRTRLHSGSLGSRPEVEFNLKVGRKVPTGRHENIIVSYFPETKPDWWCSEYKFVGAIVTAPPVLAEA